MAARTTRQAQWVAYGNWLGFWVFCFALAAIAGHRHREYGLEFALAVALLLASRVALGPSGGRVFTVGLADVGGPTGVIESSHGAVMRSIIRTPTRDG